MHKKTRTYLGIIGVVASIGLTAFMISRDSVHAGLIILLGVMFLASGVFIAPEDFKQLWRDMPWGGRT